MKLKITALFAALGLGAHGALVTEFIGTSSGSTYNEDAPGVHTLGDHTAEGDFWNGGDTGTYLYDDVRVTGSFSAVVRVVGQSQAAQGSWGKAGIMARDSLAAGSSNAMAQLATGVGSQPGGANEVPQRFAGRNNNDGSGGFEVPLQDGGGVDIPNDTFKNDGTVDPTWLRLDYDAGTGQFSAGSAPDVGGAPGTWSSSATNSIFDADTGDGWYVGLAYSAHNSLALDVAGTQGIHEVTFDNFSITQVPEPSSLFLGLGALGFLSIRRKR